MDQAEKHIEEMKRMRERKENVFQGSSETFRKTIDFRLKLRQINIWMLRKEMNQSHLNILQTLISLISSPDQSFHHSVSSESQQSIDLPIHHLFRSFASSSSDLSSPPDRPLFSCLHLNTSQIIDEASRMLLAVYCEEGKLFEAIVLMQFRWPRFRLHFHKAVSHLEHVFESHQRDPVSHSMRDQDNDGDESSSSSSIVVSFPHFFSFVSNVEILEEFLFFVDRFPELIDVLPSHIPSLSQRIEATRSEFLKYASASISFPFEHFFFQQHHALSSLLY